jgi:hypothetical protein
MMDSQALRDMRKQLGLSHMLSMPDPTELGYERENYVLPDDALLEEL